MNEVFLSETVKMNDLFRQFFFGKNSHQVQWNIKMNIKKLHAQKNI